MAISPPTDGMHDYHRILELIVRLSSRVEEPTLLEDILCSLASFWGVGTGALLLNEVRDDESRVAASIGVPEPVLRRLSGPAGAYLVQRLAADDQVTLIDDLGQDPLQQALLETPGDKGFQSAALLPLLTPAGDAIGVVILYFSREDEVSSRRVNLSELLSPSIAQLIATARAQSTLRLEAAHFRVRARKLHLVAEACMALNGEVDEVATLEKAASLAIRWLAEGCVIDIVDARGRFARTVGMCRTHGPSCGGLCSTPSDEVRRQSIQQLLRTRRPIVLRRASPLQVGMGEPNGDSPKWLRRNPVSVLFVPLVKGGHVLGAMTLVKPDAGERGDDDLLLAAEIARHTALAVENSQILRSTTHPHRRARLREVRVV